MTFSPEMTFIPSVAPYAITNKDKGEVLVNRINRALVRVSATGVMMIAKLDAHQDPFGLHTTYCVEVVPFTRFDTHWLTSSELWPIFLRGITEVFRIMKGFGLVPVVARRRGDEELHAPGGGCHLHMGADLFSGRLGKGWYDHMKALHHNLLMDYANRPYIRWLFSHWFADGGTSMYVDGRKLAEFEKSGADVFDWNTSHGTVEARYMNSMKGNHLTFELRFFSMIESAQELRLIAQFAKAWMEDIVRKTEPYTPKQVYLPFTLTSAKLKDMRNPLMSRHICRGLIEGLDLKWADYLPFYERNYRRRIRWGVFV